MKLWPYPALIMISKHSRPEFTNGVQNDLKLFDSSFREAIGLRLAAIVLGRKPDCGLHTRRAVTQASFKTFYPLSL